MFFFSFLLLIIQSQAAFVNCHYVARFTIVHSKTQIKFPLLLLLLSPSSLLLINYYRFESFLFLDVIEYTVFTRPLQLASCWVSTSNRHSSTYLVYWPRNRFYLLTIPQSFLNSYSFLVNSTGLWSPHISADLQFLYSEMIIFFLDTFTFKGLTIIFFWTGGRRRGWKIFTRKIFFICGSCSFFCLSPSSCEHFIFYLHRIYFSVYSLCKQVISKFSTNPLPRQKIDSRTRTTMWTRFVKEVKPSPDHEMVKFVF